MKYFAFSILSTIALLVGAYTVLGAAYGMNTISANMDSANDEYLSITNAAQTGLGITGDLTILAWVFPTAVSNEVVAGKWLDAGNQRSYLFHLISDIRTDFRFSTDGTDPSTHVCNSTEGTDNNVWQHIGVTYDASAGACEQFKNAKSIYTESGLGTQIFDGTAAFISGRREAGDLEYDGNIDELMVFNAILTDEEIEYVYANRGQLSGDWHPNLVGYWRMNEKSGPRVDESSNGNDLTDNNTVPGTNNVPWTGVIPQGF